MNIISAIEDRNLFRPFLEDEQGSIASWSNWQVALRTLYGQPILPEEHSLIEQCTGRTELPPDGFQTGLFLTGRRSGKSRISAICGGYEAVLSGQEKKLARGEKGLIAIVSPSKKQSRIVHSYLRSLFDTPILSPMLKKETQEELILNNGVEIWILSGDWRTIRGYTLLAAILDECCFFGLDAESKIRSDTELVRAVKPALATTGGRLIGISSPYAKKGWAFNQFKTYFGNNHGHTLVWNCPSRTMNPLLPQRIVDEAMQEDPQAARSEYGGEFRDDISGFLTKEIIETCVVTGRLELLPDRHIRYAAFADMSGGRNDSAALAIAHKGDNRKVILDFIKQYRPPHSPIAVAGQMAAELKRFNLTKVTGDAYSANFAVDSFAANGIQYDRSEKNKSELYLEILPAVCSRLVELLDNETLIHQLSSLERRTRSGGKDIVDHPAGQHDDVSNVVAGASWCVTGNQKKVCGIPWGNPDTTNYRRLSDMENIKITTHNI